jgi:hypothetical protein
MAELELGMVIQLVTDNLVVVAPASLVARVDNIVVQLLVIIVLRMVQVQLVVEQMMAVRAQQGVQGYALYSHTSKDKTWQ